MAIVWIKLANPNCDTDGMTTMTSLMMQVRLVANIHGNEAAGREILMQLGEHLLEGYGKVILKPVDSKIRVSVPHNFSDLSELIGICLLNNVKAIE